MTRERELIGKERRYLRALAHSLKPVVLVGNQGVSEAVLRAIDEALGTHELIKVKIGGDGSEQLGTVGLRIATTMRAELVQVIGRMLVLYRRRKNKPTL
ncbi:MAG TPA: ribosome assembly RNA-binding protein YhbY, partial [Polyangiaceae bacterium]|nr:ribosome assembly RNA-binding protein YhbY [Polyangiaceae bacterium]